MMLRLLAIAVFALGSSCAFTPVGSSPRAQTTSLEMKNNGGKEMVAASFLTGAFLATNALFFADAAIAATPDNNFDFGSTEMLAGRSGGRGGGRVSRAPARRAAPRAAAAPSTTTIRRTTIVQPTPVYAGPSVVVSPFGYNPLGGFGLGYGLGAMNDIGNEIRDNRQESEIQRSRAELEQARQREADLDARIRQLEAAQAAKP